MRAAAILGLGSSEKDLKPFQKHSDATWLLGLPGSANEADVVLIFGGDGTIHRHLAHLVHLQLPVLVVPHGSGNDFARALNLGSVRHALAAWKKFFWQGTNVKTIDLGVITPLARDLEPTPSPDQTHYSPLTTQNYFCCVGGVGLDGEIARRANRLPRWLRGHGGYALALAPAMFRFAAVRVKIECAEERMNGFRQHSDNPVLLAAFANAPVYGGGMKIAPHARLDDGLLDVCVVGDVGKARLLRLFPTVYFGKHLSVPEVEYFQTPCLRLQTLTPLDVYADGEYVCRTPIEVSVARGALKVVIP